MKDFKWRKSDGDWLLFHKSCSLYIAIIHDQFENGQYYVDVYYTPELRKEFLEDDLDVAKLKAEIKAAEFLKINAYDY